MVFKKNQSYLSFIKQVKEEILSSRYEASKLVNKELLILYFKVGMLIHNRTKQEAWGNKVLESISTDLQKKLPGLRGFSTTNLKYMKLFYETYSFLEIRQSSTDELKNTKKKLIRQSSTDELEPNKIKPFKDIPPDFVTYFFSVSFTHHTKIISSVKNWKELLFYIEKCATNNWTVATLTHNLEANLYKKNGNSLNNFKKQLPASIHEKAILAFKDEYLLDFINIQDPNEIDEHVIEKKITHNIKKFLMELGAEFAYMGNQYRIIVGGEEFFIDLLFYHRRLKCLVAFELKSGKFKPEYAGKMNFYLSALNKQIKLPEENPSIGIILCKEKNSTIIEYSLADINKPVGVATYKLTTKLPQNLKKYLPNPDVLVNIVNEPYFSYE